MSRSLDEFASRDINLYFGGTYVRDMNRRRILLVSGVYDDGPLSLSTTNSEGAEVIVQAADCQQWWPRMRGVNWRSGQVWTSGYLVRQAYRQARRSCTARTCRLWRPNHAADTLSWAMATEAFEPKNECGLGLSKLIAWLDERRGAKVDFTGVTSGARLLYVPDVPRQPDTGRLYYAPMGLIGTLNLANGELHELAKGGTVGKRSQRTVDRFMEG